MVARGLCGSCGSCLVGGLRMNGGNDSCLGLPIAVIGNSFIRPGCVGRCNAKRSETLRIKQMDNALIGVGASSIMIGGVFRPARARVSMFTELAPTRGIS